MKYFKYFFLLLILFSCRPPARDVEAVNFLDLLNTILNKALDVKNDIGRQKEFMEEANKINSILYLPKNAEIILKSEKHKPSENDIAYTLENNMFYLNKPVYITAGKKKDEIIFSLDRVNWYNTESDLSKNIENIKTDYFFKTDYNSKINRLEVVYSGSILPGRMMIRAEDPNFRPTISLREGMTFAHTDKKNITVDLKNYILYLPKGTKMSGNFLIEGNLAASSINSDISLKFLRDIYLYIRGRMISISFDKKDWGTTIFSFNLSQKVDISAIDNNHIFFDMHIKLEYKGSK